MSLANRIKKARRAAGLTKAQLARRIGVSRAAVGLWESGGPGPLLGNLQKIAHVTKTPISELVGGAA